MIRRVSVLATCIKIEDGPVLHIKPGMEPKNLIPNTPSSLNYKYTLSTESMMPKEHFSFMAAGNACINTLTEDESGDVYDLQQSIVTDKLLSVTVRQFIVAPVHNLDKEVKTMGFCVVDLAF